MPRTNDTFVFKTFRWLGWAAVAGYFVAALAVLGLRYVVLPRVDEWRGEIMAVVSRLLDAPVTVTRIDADWRGLHPRLRFEGLQVADAAGATVLTVPQARATLAWQSVLRGAPHLLSLELSGLDLTVQRDVQGAVWVAGRRMVAQEAVAEAVAKAVGKAASEPADAGAVNPSRENSPGREESVNSADSAPAEEASVSAQTLHWLLAQRELVVRAATLRWLDAMSGAAGESAEAEPLVLSDVQARLRNTLLSSQFAVTARPPAALAAGLSVQAELRHNPLLAERTEPRGWSGEVYVQIDDTTPQRWLETVYAGLGQVHTVPLQGRLAARAWFDLERGQLTTVVADLAARGLDWRAEAGPAATAATTAAATAATTAARGRNTTIRTPPPPSARLHAERLDLRLAGAPHEVLAGLALTGVASLTAPVATAATPALRATLAAQGVSVALPGLFEVPTLALQSLATEASVGYDATIGWTLTVPRLELDNADLAGRFDGVWRSRGASLAGSLDMQGQLTRLALASLHRYLPREVNAEARDWLGKSLTGRADGVAVVVRGDLAAFPFTESPITSGNTTSGNVIPGNATPAGQFRMAGTFQDTRIDYAPGRRGQPLGWPPLSQLRGSFEVERAALRLRVQDGVVHTGPDARVALGRSEAEIADLEHNATLALRAESSGAAADYLALMAYSPLGELLGHQFDQTRGDGNWRLPLALTVPLLDSDQTTVQGRIEFSGSNNLTLLPEVPPLSQLRGALAFTERGVTADGLNGQFLGGLVRASGALARGAAGLRLDGTVTAAGLYQAWPMPALRRLTGQTDYTAQLRLQRADDDTDDLNIHVQAPLVGLAVDFPAPLSKPASARLPLTASWGPGRQAAGRWLDVRVGGATGKGTETGQDAATGPRAEVLLQRAADSHRSRFARGAVALGTASLPGLPAVGALALAARWPELDIVAWDAALDEFVLPETAAASPSPPASAVPVERPWLPALARAQLASARLVLPFITLTDATLDITADADNPAIWQANMASTEATGQWRWQPPTARAAGQFTGRFDHVRWGAKAAEGVADHSSAANSSSTANHTNTTDGFALDAALDFPDVELSAQQFSLYGRELGTLAVTGQNVVRGRLWRVTELALANDDAVLAASGLWRLADGVVYPTADPTAESATATATTTAAPRGLALDATLTVADLGRLMTRLGVPDRVAGGHGSASGQLQWRNLPWQRRDADLTGSATVALERGTFLRASSFSARLLELLSLQSLTRLSRLDVRPDAIFRDGFRFDTIAAELGVTGSRIHTDSIQVDSPIAAILLAGDTDFRSERWNLQAAVVPKLDASGAAIAAGIAVNPLVGFGALVAQWLLKQPLARAMTAHYSVTGTWDEPEINAAGAESTRATQPEREATAP